MLANNQSFKWPHWTRLESQKCCPWRDHTFDQLISNWFPRFFFESWHVWCQPFRWGKCPDKPPDFGVSFRQIYIYIIYHCYIMLYPFMGECRIKMIVIFSCQVRWPAVGVCFWIVAWLYPLLDLCDTGIPIVACASLNLWAGHSTGDFQLWQAYI